MFDLLFAYRLIKKLLQKYLGAFLPKNNHSKRQHYYEGAFLMKKIDAKYFEIINSLRPTIIFKKKVYK